MAPSVLSSQTSVPKRLDSQTFGSQPSCPRKTSRLSNKLLVLDSQPDNPFTPIPIPSVTHTSGYKGDSVFEQTASQTVFWNELSLRSKVPPSGQTSLTPSEKALKEVTRETGGKASWPEQGEHSRLRGSLEAMEGQGHHGRCHCSRMPVCTVTSRGCHPRATSADR